MRRLVFLVAATSLLLPQLAAQEPPTVSQYRIGPHDKVQVSVDELDGLRRELEVAEDGSITVSEVGRIDTEHGRIHPAGPQVGDALRRLS